MKPAYLKRKFRVTTSSIPGPVQYFREHLIQTALLLGVTVVLYVLFEKYSPFRVDTFGGEASGTLGVWMLASWPLLAWGVVYQISVLHKRHIFFRASDLRDSIVTGAIAGVFEEITYRWLLFLFFVIFVQGLNFILGGFAGFGMLEWLYSNVLGLLANWVTLGYLESWLFHEAGWFVGTAVLASNGRFRNVHKYQGLRGILNSWFIGMFLFWMMFSYGLSAAITAHISYNIAVIAVASAVIFKRKLAW